MSTKQGCSSAYLLIVRAGGLQTQEDCPLFVSQVFLFYLGFALRAHDLPPLLRAPPSHNVLAKQDHPDPLPWDLPGNTVTTVIPLMSTVTLQPSLLPWHTKLSHFLPEINHFPGWLTVGTFISFREKRSFHPLGVILSPKFQKTATEEPAVGTFHKVWAVRSYSWLICSAM